MKDVAIIIFTKSITEEKGHTFLPINGQRKFVETIIQGKCESVYLQINHEISIYDCGYKLEKIFISTVDPEEIEFVECELKTHAERMKNLEGISVALNSILEGVLAKWILKVLEKFNEKKERITLSFKKGAANVGTIESIVVTTGRHHRLN